MHRAQPAHRILLRHHCPSKCRAAAFILLTPERMHRETIRRVNEMHAIGGESLVKP